MNSVENRSWRHRAPHALLLAGLLLVACGKKGPLYLPDGNAAPVRGATQQPANPPPASPAQE